MARPERHDVDYFPFYIKDGKTLFLLESKFECKGTGFFTNVMRFLCRQADHHICLKDEATRLWFYAKCKCDEVSGAAMLDLMAKTGKIDPVLWGNFQTIASQDLLDSIEDAYTKRKNKIITMEKIRVSVGGNTEGSELPGVETPQEGKNNSGNPQSKVKESKGKKKKNIVTIPEAKELVAFLFQKIKARKPDLKEPNLEVWEVEADRMMRIDGREFEKAKRVIEWCQSDSFWKNNILSMEKVRKHFDTLELQERERSNGRGQRSGEGRSVGDGQKPSIYPVDVQ